MPNKLKPAQKGQVRQDKRVALQFSIYITALAQDQRPPVKNINTKTKARYDNIGN